MSTDYTYDEQGEFFPYFVLTIGLLVSIPTTYSAFKPSKELENTAPRIPSNFHPEHEDLIIKQRWKQKRRERRLKRMVTAFAGWAVIGLMIYLMIVTKRSTPKIWDPYEILGLSRSSSESQIRKHYKRLSITQHPDKRTPDPAKNETLETINDAWVEVVKAFKTLTDDEVRNNYIQYGHPDGKQSFSIGIALPQFIVREGNGKYVLLLYGFLLGVLLPLLVGRWWYGTQQKTRDGILVESASNIFTEYKDDMTESDVVGALSSGAEYDNMLSVRKGDDSSSRLESRIAQTDDMSKKRLSKSDLALLLNLDNEARRKALGLLWAYLHRVDLNDPQLDEQKYGVAPVAFSLNEALQSMTLAFANTAPLLSSIHASQHLIQALPPTASPLQQLPHFSPAIIKSIRSKSSPQKADPTTSVQAFMSLPAPTRRSLVQGPGLLTQDQYNTAMTVATQLPLARIETAFFKVIGERHVTPGSLIQFVVKLRIIPPGTDPSSIPPINPADLDDPDPKEGDLDALHGRKKNKGAKTGTPDEDDRVQPPLAHAPYYARDHSPRWRVFLADHKNGKIAVPPFTFSTFDKPLFAEQDPLSPPASPIASAKPAHHRRASSISGGSKRILPSNPTPSCAIQTLKMQFQAPPQAGRYPFAMHLLCDSYLGLDSVREVMMEVREMGEAEGMDSEEDISEPEEDSLAGQMTAMRGGKVKAAGEGGGKGGKKRAVRRAEEDDEDDESDTEGESEGSGSGSDTDTDTDTDEE